MLAGHNFLIIHPVFLTDYITSAPKNMGKIEQLKMPQNCNIGKYSGNTHLKTKRFRPHPILSEWIID